MLGFVFTVPGTVIPLKVGGLTEPVTLGNLEEYVTLASEFLLVDTIRVQVCACVV